MSELKFPIGTDQILDFLPHRAPFVMLDRVLAIETVGDLSDTNFANKAGIKVHAIKNVAYNEPHLQGHFPGFAIMPGVLILEAMAQTACMSVYPYVYKNLAEFKKGFRCILVGADKLRFRRPALPGDQLHIKTVVNRVRGKLWMFRGEVFIDGQLAAEADVMANLDHEGVVR
jgi:3-hydroxyacyl-[acyl-carrier-protein] dehydratase